MKYDSIGTGYNSTRKADPYLTSRIIYLLNPESRGKYLDIGSGTGNYTSALAEHGISMTGVEPSEKMISEAQSRNSNIRWLKGSAEKIPAVNNEFDGAIATLTIHHWTDLKKGMQELQRVIKKEGKIVIFTSTSEQMKGYWLNQYFPMMLEESIQQMPALQTIKEAVSIAGLNIVGMEKYFVKNDLEDCFLYVGKNKPLLYFDSNIRHGISSFSSLANQEEVESGLAMLDSDLKQNRFEAIREKYTNDYGDYLFLLLEKK